MAETRPGQDYDGKQQRGCAWGTPGRNPYRGTVEQILVAANLPPEVISQLSKMIEQGKPTDELEISRLGIFTKDLKRGFGKTIKVMGFGDSMCFDMRVNFKKGHFEPADLYEVHVGRRTYSVMIPRVCGNVSVITEGYEGPELGETHNVPEPSTWTLMLLALASLIWTTRKDK